MPYKISQTPQRREKQARVRVMGRILKAVLLLGVLGFVGLVAYAYIADLTPQTQRVTKPVVLDGN